MKAADVGYQQRDFYDVDAAVDRLGERIDRERQVAADSAEVAKHAAILRQRAADEAAAVQLMSSTTPAQRVDGYRKFLRVLSERHRVRVRVTLHETDGASSNWRRREITIAPIVDETGFAIALHETGHLLAGECPQTEPHRRDRRVLGFWNCVTCETDAWTQALQVSPVLTRAMHASLAKCLRSYRRTPAPISAVRVLDRMASYTGYAEACANRWTQEVYRQRQAFVDASLRAQRQQWGSR